MSPANNGVPIRNFPERATLMFVVMPGLVPGSHALMRCKIKDVDGRENPAMTMKCLRLKLFCSDCGSGTRWVPKPFEGARSRERTVLRHSPLASGYGMDNIGIIMHITAVLGR